MQKTLYLCATKFLSMTIIILLLFCFLSALLPTYSAYRRLRADFSELRLALFMFMAFYALTFLCGMAIRLGDIGQNTLPFPSDPSGELSAHDISLILTTATGGLVVVNLCLGWIVWKSRRPILHSLTFVIALTVVLSLLVTIGLGSNLFLNFFMVCCGVMAYFAWLLDLTYKEFCVIGNIYIQAGVCLLSSLAPLLFCLRTKSGGTKTALSALLALLHVALFVVIGAHYWMPLENGFDLCFKELNQLAATTGTTYVFVNIVIFVLLFILDLVLNSLVYRFVRIKK